MGCIKFANNDQQEPDEVSQLLESADNERHEPNDGNVWKEDPIQFENFVIFLKLT